jgi:tetratricopeptide (TPR) repeat protein
MTGDLVGAIASYREAINVSPANPIAYYNLGLVLERSGDYDSAYAAFVAGELAAPAEARSAMARCKAAGAAAEAVMVMATATAGHVAIRRAEGGEGGSGMRLASDLDT